MRINTQGLKPLLISPMKAHPLLLFALMPLVEYGRSTQPTPARANAPTGQQVPAAYLQQAVSFIKQVNSRELANSEFILIDSSGTLNSNNCLQYALADKQLYSAAELKLIESRAAFWRYQWKKTDFPVIKIARQDTVRAIFNTRARGWEYFHKHIGRDFNEFSMPIFFRNNTYCLFYSANYCGDLCAGGSLNLYKKEGARWRLIKSYCEWVS